MISTLSPSIVVCVKIALNVHVRLVVNVSILAALAACNHMRIHIVTPLGGRVGRLLVVIVALLA